MSSDDQATTEDGCTELDTLSRHTAQALHYANAAHEHFEAAVHSMGQADRTNDVRSWQNFLAEARAHVGISRLALELGHVPDTRAVRE